ncbi:hypothetical protein BJ138DRAFT_1158281 [Hygrophoropsis aurantiaca]|uniref:Uncharacterized protein n=1 Tax=Hygrophoropsis aurantiaca TaxID=72124 RepID=A0ACB8A4K8_9AGAM|nr:hypothetical protein BJ138DRAFT_1158281 [Hygrophoropsis aurantiaca]
MTSVPSTRKRLLSPSNSPSQGYLATRVRFSDAPENANTLEYVPDDIDPDVHEALDKAVISEITTTDASYELADAALLYCLLSVIVDQSPRLLNSKYSDRRTVLELFKKYPVLKIELKKAWEIKSFSSIRRLRILRSSNAKLPSWVETSNLDIIRQIHATEWSWKGAFHGNAHEYLWDYITRHFGSANAYQHDGHCAAIVQSSGMGKSRVVDQLSKTRFVIPVNLRLGDSGYPPPDKPVRAYLCTNGDQNEFFLRSCGFLTALFIETRLVITNHADAVRRPSHLPAIDSFYCYGFREYMTDDMTLGSHGLFRRMFYQAVIKRAEEQSTKACKEYMQNKYPTNHPFPPSTELEELTKAINRVSAPSASSTSLKEEVKEHQLVILAFDEVHTLIKDQHSKLGQQEVWTNFTELIRALRYLNDLPIFSVFLSTNGKIAMSADPRGSEPPSAMWMFGRALASMEPYYDIGFDQLAIALTFSGSKVRKIDEFTNDNCISHFGHPLFGSRYDYGDMFVRYEIVDFAMVKLLGSDEVSTAANLTKAQKLACISRRFPIEFISTSYAHHEEEMEQVERHMRVYLKVGAGFESMTTVSSSEPLLSEAAYSIMCNKDFDAPQALLTILKDFSVCKGDRGELLVMLLLTLARDAAVGAPNVSCKPVRRWTTVPDFFSHLFSAYTVEDSLVPVEPLSSNQDKISSAFGQVVGPNGVTSSRITFHEQFHDARVYFNHMIKVHQPYSLTRTCLAALFYRGAAIICGNKQSVVDGVIPICMGEELKPENMGAILWQVNNDSTYSSDHKAPLFENMDPHLLNIFREDDEKASFRAPLIRIVFAVATKTPNLKVVKVHAPADSTFTTYDIWCGGLSPDILGPIDSKQTEGWDSLLEATYEWKEMFKSAANNPAQMDIRRSSYPGAAADAGHWSWCPEALSH